MWYCGTQPLTGWLLWRAHSRWIIVCVALVFVWSTTSDQSWAQDNSAALIDQINVKLDELHDASYAKREDATDFLGLHPQESIPLILKRLGTDQPLTDNPLPEASLRMLRLLSNWATDPTSENGRNAVTGLQKLSEGTSTVAAIRAQNLLAELTLNYSNIVEVQLRSTGVYIGNASVQVVTTQERGRKILRIDDDFHGNADDLEGIRWLVDVDLIHARGKSITGPILKRLVTLPNLRVLQLRDVSLTPEDLEPLRNLRNLESLEIIYSPLPDSAVSLLAELPVSHSLRLFGTGLSEEAVADLSEQLEGVEFIFGRGGFLGIATIGVNSNIIRNVVKDGGAERAGLRPEDQITAINRVPIVNFDGIRRELSKYAPNENVHIDFERRILQTNEDGPPTWAMIPMNVDVTLGLQE
jgi:hypothetical protein